jgi:outer membrane protein assembly factor BamB
MPCLRSIWFLLLTSGLTAAGDWPQWLGPQRDGSSSEKVQAWKAPPKVLWREPVGEGHSSPIVAGGRVILHTRLRDREDEEIVAFDAKTGKEIWRQSYPRGKYSNIFGNGPRATPALADGRLYTFGVTGILSCFDAASGKQLWQVDTLKEFQATNLLFGASSSPIVLEDKVLVSAGNKGGFIAAFHCKDGSLAWKNQDDPASYSSPIRIGKGKTEQVIFLTGKRLLGLQPADGSVFWEFPLVDKLFESSTTPVRVGDLLLASSITYGSVGLKLAEKDGKPSASKVWKNDELTCYFSTPVAVSKEHVYMVTGSNPLGLEHVSTLRCLEAGSGKVLWSRPKVGKYHASLLRTGNDQLLMLDDAGNLVLLEPNAKEYSELARTKICGETWAHPALADGRLYVRDNKELICVQFAE